MAELSEIRESVRRRYAAAAKATAGEGGCWGGGAGCGPAAATDVFGGALYGVESRADAADAAVAASLGCGVPTAVADLHQGEVVLDLGSGAGADVLISARRVGPTGKAIGLDMTDEMLDRARGNAHEAGVENAEFLKGYIEDVPLPDASVDVVISNCVINLSADKRRVIREAARVLRPGGRFAVSDVIADPDMDEATRADMEQWTGCIAGALTRSEFEQSLADAGFEDVEIRETHRVHEHAGAAIVRARRPAGADDVALAECRLDLPGLRAQRERYRRLGGHVERAERQPQRLAVRFGVGLDEGLLRETLDVERHCCPFFAFAYDPRSRELAIGVEDPGQDPALDALQHALTECAAPLAGHVPEGTRR